MSPPNARHDHTARLLAGRLEELARASERRPARGEQQLETRVLAALAATRHAIQLGLLSTEEADAIWASVAERHPQWHATSRSWHATSRPSGRLSRADQRAKPAYPGPADVAA